MLSDDAGFTLIELLVATLIGGVILASSVAVLTGANQRADAVERRTQATLQARQGIDAAARELRAQSCLILANQTPKTPIITASASSVTFYADLSGGKNAVERRTLTLTTASQTPPSSLVENVWFDASSTSTTPDRTRILASNVQPGLNPDTNQTAFLTYYAYDTSQSPPVATKQIDPGTGTLTDAQEATVARMSLWMVAQPRGTQDGTRLTTVGDDVDVRLADPDGAVVPVCTS